MQLQQGSWSEIIEMKPDDTQTKFLVSNCRHSRRGMPSRCWACADGAGGADRKGRRGMVGQGGMAGWGARAGGSGRSGLPLPLPLNLHLYRALLPSPLLSLLPQGLAWQERVRAGAGEWLRGEAGRQPEAGQVLGGRSWWAGPGRARRVRRRRRELGADGDPIV